MAAPNPPPENWRKGFFVYRNRKGVWEGEPLRFRDIEDPEAKTSGTWKHSKIIFDGKSAKIKKAVGRTVEIEPIDKTFQRFDRLVKVNGTIYCDGWEETSHTFPYIVHKRGQPDAFLLLCENLQGSMDCSKLLVSYAASHFEVNFANV